ncbi:F-box protein [Candidatus Protochlamydia phocaeensis]|uniref:F-box protein n=1 Tax=Candidatus Protochlamydia phocaeensis TaxID=1414722 RepID=UPI00083994FB|nr:F-box protein [Candidatus Protochlamydia phocaeensis]
MAIGFYQLPSNTQWPALNMRFLFKEGAANIRFACSSDPIRPIAEQRFAHQETQQAVALNLSRRITHLAVGILLCLPIINTIAYLALQYLQTRKGHAELPQQTENSVNILPNSQLPPMETEHSQETPLPVQEEAVPPSISDQAVYFPPERLFKISSSLDERDNILPNSQLPPMETEHSQEAPLLVQEEAVPPSISDQAVYFPQEMLFEIFSYLDETDLEAAKLVCQDWQAVATDPLLVPPLKKQIQAEVQKVRLHLSNCMMSSEGRVGGYWMQLWVDEQGSIHALDGHDANTVWLNAEIEKKRPIHDICAPGPQNGLYPLEFLVQACNWEPNKNSAFRICEFSKQNDFPAKIKNIQQLILDEFNQLAKGAQQIAKDKQIKAVFKIQGWVKVIIDSAYSRSQLILASKESLPNQNLDP